MVRVGRSTAVSGHVTRAVSAIAELLVKLSL